MTTSTITYTTDFKVKIANCKNLTEARQLMIDNHVPLEVIGERRFENSYYQLRNQMKKKGNAAFASEQRGRKASITSAGYNALSAEEKVTILEKRISERDEGIDFLKKYMHLCRTAR